MKINITADTKRVQASLRRLRKVTTDKSSINRKVANLLETTTRKRFRTQKAPDGSKWQDNADSTIKIRDSRYKSRKKKKTDHTRSLLIGDTRVLSAIRSRYSKDKVVIGTTAIYGAIHQYGGSAGRGGKVKIPARPFLGISNSDQKAVVKLFRKEIRKAVGGAQ